MTLAVTRFLTCSTLLQNVLGSFKFTHAKSRAA